MLKLIFSAFGTKLRNGDSRCIINNKIGATDNIRSFYQLRPVLVFQISGTEILGIHVRFHSKKTVYQLLLGHLQTENSHGHIFTKRHILGNIQYKGSFSHGRSSCDQYKIGRVHTGSLIIQIHKSGRNPGNGALQLGSLLNIADCIQHNLLDRHIIATICSLQNIKQLFLGFLKYGFRTVLFQITGIGNFFRSPYQPTENCLFAYDIGIVFHIG